MAKKISGNVSVCNNATASLANAPTHTPAKVLFAQAQAAAETAARLQIEAERAREEEREIKARVRALQNVTAKQDADEAQFFAPAQQSETKESVNVWTIVIACSLVAITFLLLILACIAH